MRNRMAAGEKSMFMMSAVLVICQQMKNFSQEMPTTMKEVNKFHCDAAVKRKLNKKSSIAEWKGG